MGQVFAAPPYAPGAFSVLTWNVAGNGATNWSTNATQVQAIGRVVQYLQPDVVTFLEIPNDLTYEMTNFVRAYLPGYALATNSGTDGYIRSVIASRFPITRAQSWLARMDLRSFGYSNANNNLDNFTRDLFEAQINVPDFEQPLHVFTTHLKAGGTADDIAKRAAEAAAISNYFAAGFLLTNANHPYLLTGDFNETDTNALSVKRLISGPTGLHLTTPVNPSTGSDRTWSIRAANLTARLDYFLPGTLLFGKIMTGQVFRTDRIGTPPPPLLAGDSATASDHLPVLMVFAYPFNPPFRLLSSSVSNSSVTLTWQTFAGRKYHVQAATDLAGPWQTLVSNLTATGANLSFSTNASAPRRNFRVLRVP